MSSFEDLDNKKEDQVNLANPEPTLTQPPEVHVTSTEKTIDTTPNSSPKETPEGDTASLETTERTTSLIAGNDSKSSEKTVTFNELDLKDELAEAIKALKWETPTPVQYLSLPHSLKGKDVAGFAQTGTGKTGAFLITIGNIALENKKKKQTNQTRNPFAVVLSPTRELAIQIEEECRRLLGHLDIVSAAIYGGTSWEGQAKQLKDNVDIIIATPGRLKDYFDKKMLSLDEVAIFICDEADRMFDMGFIDDVEFFLSKISENAQKLVFSATTNDRVNELVFKFLNSPEYISVNQGDITPDNITQHALVCETKHKFKLLLWLLQEHQPEIAMIFTNTKLTAQWLLYKLSGNSIDVDLITGDLPQAKRTKLLKKIKEGKTRILIATDVASRGIHIPGISHVYNFDIPDDAANYVHRIGRTARAGAKGESYSIICDEYASNYLSVQEILGNHCPATSWPNDNFLATEDKAGNPFEDESSVLFKEFTERGDRNKRYERNDKDRFSKRSDSGKNRSSHQERGRYNKDQNFNKSRNRKPQHERDYKRSKPHHKKHKIHSARTTPVVPKNTFWGRIKRFFVLLFKGKSK